MKKIRDHQLNVNESGMALVTVLMVVIVVSILALGLMGMTVSNMKMSSGERNTQTAYYIAESGLTNELSIIKSQITDMYNSSDLTSQFFQKFENEFVNKTIPDYTDFDSSFVEKPVAKIKVEPVTDSTALFTKDYKLISTGYIGNRSRTVVKNLRVTWNPKSNFNVNIETNTVLFMGTNLDWSNTPATIDGSVGLGGNAYTKFTGSKAPNILDYGTVQISNPEFPAFIVPNGAVPFSGSLIKMDRDMYYSTITVNNNSTLVMDVGSQNRNLVVDTLQLGTSSGTYGNIKLNGTGKLTIYAKKISLYNGSIINTDGNSNILNIFLEGSGATLNNGIIYGSMFAKSTDFTIADNTGVQGNIITGGNVLITLNNSKPVNDLMPKIVFAPQASVQANLNFKGAIIASSFKSSGNNHSFIFTTKEITTSTFINNKTVNLSFDPLLSTEPTQEK